ncbi:hypothetical protein GGD70_008091 [Paraburkholderia fungorum]|nr:hypothetical protein [Paraburkholderia fungorum]
MVFARIPATRLEMIGQAIVVPIDGRVHDALLMPLEALKRSQRNALSLGKCLSETPCDSQHACLN